MKLTVDARQQKLVVPLIVVLVAAVSVTVLRMRAQTPVPPQLAPGAAAKDAAPVKPTAAIPAHIVEEHNTGRNPFDHPFLHGAAGSSQETARPVNPLAPVTPLQVSVSPGNPSSTHPGTSALQPLPSTADHTTGASAQPAAEAGHTIVPANQPAQPQYVLNAVVHGPKGWMAVISSGDGPIQAVREGNLLDGNCRVKRIDQGIVVLSLNGKPIILHMPGEGSEVSGG